MIFDYWNSKIVAIIEELPGSLPIDENPSPLSGSDHWLYSLQLLWLRLESRARKKQREAATLEQGVKLTTFNHVRNIRMCEARSSSSRSPPS